MVTTISLLDEEEEEEDGVDGQATLVRLDAWYAYYHRQFMVSWSSVYPFQTGSPVVEWVSPAAHGLGLDCGAGLEKQLGGGGISRRQYLGQRLDRVSKLGHLGATESVCLYDLCQNLDRIATLGAQRDDGDPAAFLVKMQTLDDMVLKRPAATSSTVPAKKTTKKPGRSPKKKKKKSFMRGMLEEGLLAGYKSVEPTPRARRRLNPAEGWEDWAKGRKLRRPLAGNDY